MPEPGDARLPVERWNFCGVRHLGLLGGAGAAEGLAGVSVLEAGVRESLWVGW